MQQLSLEECFKQIKLKSSDEVRAVLSIFEESTYLVNSRRVVFIHIKHPEDDNEESGGIIVVVMGKCIKCELAGVRNIFLTPALRL